MQRQPVLLLRRSRLRRDRSCSRDDRQVRSTCPLPPLGLGPMISVTTPPHGLARLHAGLVSPHGHACPHTVSPPSLSAPDPSLSAPDQPSLSTPDPSPSASDPSLSAQDHSISAPSLPCNCQPVVLLRWSRLLRDCSWARDVRQRSIGGQGDYFLVLTLHGVIAPDFSLEFAGFFPREKSRKTREISGTSREKSGK